MTVSGEVYEPVTSPSGGLLDIDPVGMDIISFVTYGYQPCILIPQTPGPSAYPILTYPYSPQPTPHEFLTMKNPILFSVPYPTSNKS